MAGLNVRISNISKASILVWHIVRVHENSPASESHLESNFDYVIGIPGILFDQSEDFYNFVKINQGIEIKLYVYSTRTHSTRIVEITPRKDWGGKGLLGCDVSFGISHRLYDNKSIEGDSQIEAETKVKAEENSQSSDNNTNDIKSPFQIEKTPLKTPIYKSSLIYSPISKPLEDFHPTPLPEDLFGESN